MKSASCRCGAVWHDNHGAAHCAACHRTWSSIRAFDVHRVDVGGGTRGCVDPDTHLRKDGQLMFAARTDKLGTTVWEHAAGAQKARDRFRGTDQTETGPGAHRPPTLSLPNPPPAYTAT